MVDRSVTRGKGKGELETRGRKPAKKINTQNGAGSLPEKPPALCSTPGQKKCYRELREYLINNPKVSEADALMVADVAVLMDQKIKLSKMVDKLKTYMIPGAGGKLKVHPLLAELRQTQNAYRQALGQLLLSPRARASARVTLGPKVTPGAPAPLPPPSNSPSDLRLFGSLRTGPHQPG